MSLPVFLKSLHSIGLPWHGLINYTPGGTPTVTRDSDNVVQNLGTGFTSVFPDAWRLQKDGIGAVTTPEAVSDLGGEWRNEALQPNATGGWPCFFDESGKPWSIRSMTVEVVSGEVLISMQVRPFGIIGDGISYASAATLSATVTGLTGLDFDGDMVLASINLTGRKQIWMLPEYIESNNLNPFMMHGIVEVQFSGSGSYTTWPGTLSGLSVTAVVLKTEAQCDWNVIALTNTSSSTDCHQMIEQDRIFHAWYDNGGTIRYLTAKLFMEDTSSASESYGSGVGSWDWNRNFEWWQEITDGINTVSADPFTIASTASGTFTEGGTPPFGDSTASTTTIYSIGATVIGTVNITESWTGQIWAGGPGPSCSAYASATDHTDFGTAVYDGDEVREDGTVISSTVEQYWFTQKIRLISNNLFGVVQGAGEIGVAGIVGQWDGFLHPGGTVAGFSADVSISWDEIGGLTHFLLFPTEPWGAYNPYNGDVVVGQQYPVGYV